MLPSMSAAGTVTAHDTCVTHSSELMMRLMEAHKSPTSHLQQTNLKLTSHYLYCIAGRVSVHDKHDSLG